MKHSNFSILLTVFVLFCISFSLTADQVHLQGGEVIVGTIVSMNDTTVVVKTSYGSVTIDREHVVSGSFGAASSDFEDTANTQAEKSLSLTFNSALDGSGNLKTTRIGNPKTGTDRLGIPDAALYTGGNGSYLQLSDWPRLNDSNEFTVAFDFTVFDLSKTGYLVSKWTGASGSQADGKFAVSVAKNGVRMYVVDADGNYHTVKGDFQAETAVWYHLVCTSDGSDARLYLNGELIGSSDDSWQGLFKEEAPVLIMTAPGPSNQTGAFYNVNGAIDNIVIMTSSVTSGEAEDLATAAGY